MPGSAEENDISNGSADTGAPDVTQNLDVQPAAESSTAQDDKGSLFDAVKAALDGQTEKPSSSDEPGSETGKTDADATAKEKGAEADEEPEDLTEDELSQLKPKTHRRIRYLTRLRHQQEKALAEREATISEISPKAQQFDQIVGFVDKAGLSKDEVNDGFAVMRDLKQNPEAAYQRLKPIMAQLAQMFGEGALPDDLRQEVATGQITEQRARELATARSRTTLAETRARVTDERTAQERAINERQALVGGVETAVNEWEASKAKADPSWKLKQPRIKEIVKAVVLERMIQQPGYFPTREEALRMSEDALKRVNDDFKAFAPRPRAVNPLVDAGSSPSVAKPTSAVEAARQALSQMAG